jgi:hypothetical protein
MRMALQSRVGRAITGAGFDSWSWETIRERYYPLAGGIATALAWWLWGVHLVEFSESHNWHLDQIYTAMFGFTAVTTGFLGTFYGTIQSMTTGFISRIRDTTVLRVFLRYTKNAIIVGFVSSLISMAMMVVAPLPRICPSWESAASSIWMLVSVWAVLGFYRVASLLFPLFETHVPDERSDQ